MSREDYEMLKQIQEWQEKRKNSVSGESVEDDSLIIEQNTIYEIDYDCFECLLKEKKKYLQNNKDE